MDTSKNIIGQVSLPWILFIIGSVSCVIIIIAICVCWQGRKKHTQTYIMKSDNISQAELPTNMMPHIIMDQKQKYFMHGVKYSSINNSDEVNNDHFSYNILSIFRNIQKNKFNNTNDDMAKIAKMLPDTLEDSHTDAMHKNFDKSVLSLQWNETPTDSNSRTDKDEVYSCISADSKETFASVIPHYNRSYSAAETFKSINSEN